MLKKVIQQGRSNRHFKWVDGMIPTARPTRGVLDRALREQGDRPSYPSLFSASLLGFAWG